MSIYITLAIFMGVFIITSIYNHLKIKYLQAQLDIHFRTLAHIIDYLEKVKERRS